MSLTRLVSRERMRAVVIEYMAKVDSKPIRATTNNNSTKVNPVEFALRVFHGVKPEQKETQNLLHIRKLLNPGWISGVQSA